MAARSEILEMKLIVMSFPRRRESRLVSEFLDFACRQECRLDRRAPVVNDLPPGFPYACGWRRARQDVPRLRQNE
jgi:hypothetical protein